jgi:hypothetical protein
MLAVNNGTQLILYGGGYSGNDPVKSNQVLISPTSYAQLFYTKLQIYYIVLLV